MESLLASLERDSFSRLRWVVCRRLGISPVSLKARTMGRTRLIICAANLVLDMGRLPAGEVSEAGGNPEFDERLFRELARRK